MEFQIEFDNFIHYLLFINKVIIRKKTHKYEFIVILDLVYLDKFYIYNF
jgi:hypothetical protein